MNDATLFFNAVASVPPTGYQIERSLRFNSSDSAYLSRTPSTAGNRKTWTWAGWVKRSGLGTQQAIFSATDGSSNTSIIQFLSSDQIEYYEYTSGSYAGQKVTTAVYRDPGAWYHVVAVRDTPSGTASERMRLYVNGVEVTTFSTNTNPSPNADSRINSTVAHDIGRLNAGGGFYLNGYLADIHFIDGQALDPTSFGEFDTNGVWQPKAYSGSYGTNGFHLPFSDNSTAAALGTDTSGNGNDWTPNNLSVLSGTIASSGGGIPILNTTDAYGTVLGSGVRSDSNASSLSLALALGTSSGLNLTDQIPTGRTASAHTVTNTNVTNSTSTYKYYGGSATFDGTDDYLTITTTSALVFGTGDFTVEFWIKPDNSVNDQAVINQGSGGANFLAIGYYGNQNSIFIYDTTWRGYSSISNGVWSHVAFVKSGTTLTTYINGTIGATTTGWTPNFSSTDNFYIGRKIGTLDFKGNLQDVRFYKGLAKYTSTFSVPNLSTGAANDSLVDSPTNYGTDTGAGGEVRGNYATLNPINKSSQVTLANGNLDYSASGANTNNGVLGTVGVSSGKWYWEYTCTSSTSGTSFAYLGIAGVSAAPSTLYGFAASNYIYQAIDGNKKNNNVSGAYGASWTTNDVIGVAFDADNGTLTFYKNGSTQGTAYSSIPAGTYTPSVSAYAQGTVSGVLNAGARPFAYTAPSGFKALCTTNLPEPTIADGSTAMDAVLYTGNSTDNRAITGLGFSPDLVWFGPRSQSGQDKVLCDSVRGVQKALFSNQTYVEADPALYGSVGSFDADGFTIKKGTDAVNGYNQVNLSGSTYVAWTWDAGSSTVTNTQGSITSQVRANASAGFSVVTWSGTSSSGSIGHDLNATPGLILCKDRGSNNWVTQHTSTGQNYMVLNLTLGSNSDSNIWSAAPTSSTFSVGSGSNVNASGHNYVAYCFAPVAGYSSFGSYTGNGSADGPFVYTGHKSRWLMIKKSSNTGSWIIWDSARDTYNYFQYKLGANLSSPENDAATIGYANQETLDSCSNGFKLRSTNQFTNASGDTYIYAAFAEHPFATARAR